MKITLLISLLLSMLLSPLCRAQDVTRWRGAQQTGYYPDEGLLKEWPENGPEILWTFEALGEGYSSPAFAHDRIYLSGMEGETGYLYALSNEGDLIWKVPYGEEFYESYPGSRSTPVIAGDKLYMLSGKGVLSCSDALQGTTVWTADLFETYGGRNLQWGITETPVVHNNTIYCTPGGRKHNIVALDRHTGKLLWTAAGKGEKSAYCTPLLVSLGSRQLLVTHTEDHILGLDADTGTLLWTHPHTNRWSVHPNTPLYFNRHVFCFSGYGQGGVMLQLSEDGSSVTKKWFSETLDSRMGGAVVLNGYIYGSGDKNRAWQCLDWVEGRQRYASKELGNGTLITADGMLYCYSQRGELALVEANPAEFRIVSESRVTLGSGQHWAHPVINHGRLFVRHGNALIAYKIR